MRIIVERAPAKVNLALHVIRRRPDGYHELDSLVAFVPQVADVVMLQAAQDFAIEVRGPFAAALTTSQAGKGDNLALAAARLLHERWPRHFAPVRITLVKNLPVAAGIGGGSADAAAVLRGCARLSGFAPPPRELAALALKLGADVPVCLRARAARMGGIGERVVPHALPPLPVLLVNPQVALSTAAVFARLRAMPQAMSRRPLPAGMPAMARAAALAEALQAVSNDLEAPACALSAAVARCLRVLRALPGVRLARMSGSGATCLALFDTPAAAARARRLLLRRHPRWWVRAGSLR